MTCFPGTKVFKITTQSLSTKFIMSGALFYFAIENIEMSLITLVHNSLMHDPLKRNIENLKILKLNSFISIVGLGNFEMIYK